VASHRGTSWLLDRLEQDDVEGKIVFLEYNAIDPAAQDWGTGARIVTALVQKNIAGLVLVTDEGYGKGVGDEWHDRDQRYSIHSGR